MLVQHTYLLVVQDMPASLVCAVEQRKDAVCQSWSLRHTADPLPERPLIRGSSCNLSISNDYYCRYFMGQMYLIVLSRSEEWVGVSNNKAIY